MTFNTQIRDALSVATSKDPGSTRNAIEGRYPYILLPGENASDFVPYFTQAIEFGGRIFSRDDTDTTTPHDGVLCIVTNGGVRFKSDTLGYGAIIRRYAVIGILSAPPASPVVGGYYLIDAGATGVWATHDKKITSWTTAGWKFIVPKTYDEAHVANQLQIYHYNASSVWTAGSSAIVLADNSVLFTKLRHGLGQGVENATTNTPPPSPSEGVCYVVGGSPTGVWSGHAFKIAYYTNSSWLFLAPAIGWSVYDKAIKSRIDYTATGWVSSASGIAKIARSAVANTTPLNITGTYAYSDATAPTTSNMTLLHTFSYTPKRAGALIDIQVDIRGVSLAAGTVSISGTTMFSLATNFAVFIDSGANAVDWARGTFGSTSLNNSNPSFVSSFSGCFQWAAPDASTHDIKIYGSKQNPSGLSGGFTASASRSTIQVSEYA